MLQVRIHTDDAISVRVINACYHRCLMAKVAGEGYELDFLIPGCILPQDGKTVIPASVIDKQ